VSRATRWWRADVIALTPGPPRLVAALTVVFAAACFGTLGPASNLAYAAGVEPVSFVFWRGAIGSLFVLGLIAVRRRAGALSLVSLRVLPRREWLGLFIAIAAGAALNVAIFSAFARVPVALALLCFYTFPAMVTVADVVLHGERLDAPRIAALALALAGMVLVVGAPLDPAAGLGLDAIGVLLALAAAVFQTIYIIAGRRGFSSVPTEQAASVILIGSALGYLGVAAVGGALAGVAGPLADSAVWPVLLYAGVLGAGIPSLLFLFGVRWLGGTRTAILALWEPVVGILLAALLLRQGVSALQLAGGALVLVAAAVLQRPAVREPIPAAPSTMPGEPGREGGR
jgi:drug/metabolite transporter (DMT)-like permease